MKQIVVAPDNRSHSSLVLIGVNTHDRPGLLLDISKCLLQLKLQVHRTEAVVHDEQSISVWRCSNVENEESDAEQISAMLNVGVNLCRLLFVSRCSKPYKNVDVFFTGGPRKQRRR
jgi:predicted amino acid-binding ACT domain protein